MKWQNIKPLGEFRDRGVYEKELDNILKNKNYLERCIDLFCYIQRAQMFIDGNKRVANLVANKEMIRNGQGILAVPVEKIGTYLELLISYYETGNNIELKNWIYENCIDGI